MQRSIIHTVLVLLVSLNAESAWASFLQILGSGQLNARLEGETVKFSGSYTIENRGDESARNVFPTFSIGAWSWAGDQKEINAGGKESWNIDATFKSSDLACKEADLCAGQKLPLVGRYPLLIRRHYEDANGAPFSAAEVGVILIGELSGEALVATRTPELDGRITCDGDGETFDCRVELRNAGQAARSASLGFFSSRELQVLTPPQVVQVPVQELAETRAKFKNFSGLPGSSYATFAVLQWESNGIRNSRSISSILNVKRPDRSNRMIWVAAVALLLALGALYMFVMREGKEARGG